MLHHAFHLGVPVRSRLFHAIVGVAVSVAGPSSIGCSDPARSDAIVDPPPADSIAAEPGDDASEAVESGVVDAGFEVEDTTVRVDSAPKADVGVDARADADASSDSDAAADVADAVTDVPTDADAEAGWHPTK